MCSTGRQSQKMTEAAFNQRVSLAWNIRWQSRNKFVLIREGSYVTIFWYNFETLKNPERKPWKNGSDYFYIISQLPVHVFRFRWPGWKKRSTSWKMEKLYQLFQVKFLCCQKIMDQNRSCFAFLLIKSFDIFPWDFQVGEKMTENT